MFWQLNFFISDIEALICAAVISIHLSVFVCIQGSVTTAVTNETVFILHINRPVRPAAVFIRAAQPHANACVLLTFQTGRFPRCCCCCQWCCYIDGYDNMTSYKKRVQTRWYLKPKRLFCQQRPGGLTPPLSRTWSQGRNVWSARSTNLAGYIRRIHKNMAVICQMNRTRKIERKMNKYRQQEVTGRRTYLDSQVYRLIIRLAPCRAPASKNSKPMRARL